jgi:hypothetical protein
MNEDEKLFKEIEKLSDGSLISIDGFMNSGKTFLAQRLSKKLKIQYIDTDCYVLRQSDSENYVSLLDIEHLKEIVSTFARNKKSLIYVGICAQESLEKLGVSSHYRVYVKQISTSGLWHPEHDIENYKNDIDSLGYYSRQPHTSDIEYHIAKEPHNNANFVHKHVRD